MKKLIPVDIPEGDSCLDEDGNPLCPLWDWGDENHCYCKGWNGKLIVDGGKKHEKCKGL